jgi:SDR family mycofactocin-dependent oxidoreductase
MNRTNQRNDNIINRRAVASRRNVLTGSAAALIGLTATAVHGQAVEQPASSTTTIPSGRLSGQVALITGAARGIGRSTALTLAREGADIIAVDVGRDIKTVPYPLARPNDLQTLEAEVRAMGRRILAVQSDVRDMKRLREIVTQGIAEMGKIDICHANAGIASFARLESMTDEDWSTTIDVNLTGAVNTMRAVIPHMISRKRGRIIVTSSEGGRRGTGPGLSAYGAAKWGLIGVVKTAQQELAQHNITVNAICPGSVKTGMTQNQEFFRLARPDLPNPTAEDQAEVVLKANIANNKLPISWLDPQDIANMVLFLASEEGRYVAGAALDVTAGTSASYTA